MHLNAVAYREGKTIKQEEISTLESLKMCNKMFYTFENDVPVVKCQKLYRFKQNAVSSQYLTQFVNFGLTGA